MVQKVIFGVPFGRVSGGWYPQTMSNYLSVKYLLISKKLEPLAYDVPKLIFVGCIWGFPKEGCGTPKVGPSICLYVLISKKLGP